MSKNSNAVENYFQNVIKNSWTWDRLTCEERRRFIEMNVFDRIQGTEKQRTEWLSTIYSAFLIGIGYEPIGWRETEETPKF